MERKLIDTALTVVLILCVLVSGGAIGYFGYRLFRDKMHRPLSVGFGVIAGVVVASNTAEVLLPVMSLF